MSIITYPLNLIEYTAENVESYLSMRSSGVLSVEDNLNCTVTGDREITISPGLAWIKNTPYGGKSIYADDDTVLELDVADGALTRIDRVVVRFTKASNASAIVVKKGTPSSSPTPPTLEQTEAVYELGLYAITIPAASLSITSSNITDTRLDETVCGLMRDGIEKIPTQALYDQYEAFLAESTQTVSAWMQDSEAEFEAWMDNQSVVWDDWFSTIQDALGDDVAGQLLLMILDTDDQLSAHTDDQAIHVTPAEKAAWNKAASGASPTALYASAGDLPSATADIQATKGKALVGSVTTDTAAGTQVISLALGSQALAYGTYSCVARLKSNYSGSAGTSFLTLKVEHVSGDVPTTLGTAAIRDSDVYRTDNYCVFAMGFDFLGPWAEGDSFRLTVEAAAAVEATVSLDYVAVNLAGATLLTL